MRLILPVLALLAIIIPGARSALVYDLACYLEGNEFEGFTEGLMSLEYERLSS